MNVAIILAAGSGTRIGGSTPKQFLCVGGKTILEHTLNAFEQNANIDEIAIVTKTEYINTVKDITKHIHKVRHVIAGGKERTDSTVAALKLYTSDSDNLLFHDCVRPLVSQAIINRCIDALKKFGAVGVAVNCTDTIWQTDDSGFISNIPPRDILRSAQTPQAFHRSVIDAAYKQALNDINFQATDDCGVVRRYLPNEPIFIVEGEPTNIKVTYAGDLDVVEKLLKKSTDNYCS